MKTLGGMTSNTDLTVFARTVYLCKAHCIASAVGSEKKQCYRRNFFEVEELENWYIGSKRMNSCPSFLLFKKQKGRTSLVAEFNTRRHTRNLNIELVITESLDM